MKFKTTLLSSCGAGLEYYDFVIYALMSPYLSQLFFPKHNHITQLMQTFIVFGLGYIARPIGGILFGLLGDRYGRKKSLVQMIALMGFSTLFIACLPTYAHVGLMAPLLLLLGRILQGISYGGDLPCAVIFVAEHADKKNRGAHCGTLITSVALGVSSASLINYILNTAFTTTQMMSFGWRIPFLIGASLAAFSYYIRVKLLETPIFTAQSHRDVRILKILFSQYHKQVIQGIFLILLASSLVMFGLMLPSYLSTLYHFKLNHIYLALTLGSLWCALCVFLFSFLSDKIGRKQLMIITTSLIALFSWTTFTIPQSHHISALFIFIFIYETMLGALAACYFTMLSELFPTEIRFTGFAFCYNTVYALAASVPALIAYWLSSTGADHKVAIAFTVLAIITAINCITLKNKTGVAMH